MKRPEQALQIACASYLYGRQEYMKDLTFAHIPNGGGRTKAEAGIFKAMGVQSGAPDLIVWMRDRTIQIELKAKGGRISPAQEAFGARLTALGYEYHVITSTAPNDAVTQLEAILEAK